ncbi:unnamed protein product, partial [Mesorhabditis belari]|uniref:DUF1907 domain-containing protein n=1 Tax=Mesorhabditis belari TaxID=2138241 RepID=A0AAF3EIP5_9BILA
MSNCSRSLSSVFPLHVPPLNELGEAIREGLQENFNEVNVQITPCPDLRSEEIGLVSRYFGASMKLADIGGPGNLFPQIHKEKKFDIKEICELCESGTGSAFGPGAGPWPVVGTNSEMVADVDCGKDKVATKIAKIVDSEKGYATETITSPTFSLMANLAITGDPEKQVDVVHIHAKVRKGKLNFTDSIRQAVAKCYGEQAVSLGGVFIIRKGKAKLHVMPDFPACPWNTEDEITRDWLKYFEMSAPLVCCSVMHSHDPGHHLRMEHTHCFSKHGDGGHYHYDTTPEEVEYEGWFAPAEKVFRIDEI